MATVALPKLAKDISGQRFNRLTAVTYMGAGANGRGSVWLCVCDCGQERMIIAGDLRRGLYQSCGCYHRDWQAKRFTTHGKSKHPLYGVWRSMKERCQNPKSCCYKNYGGRGIKVCEAWEASFETFAADMGERPQGGQIERIDNDGDYCPDNCRWATRKEQCRNRRVNHFIVIGETKKCITDWAAEYGIKPLTILARIYRGWPPEKAVTTPLIVRRPV